MNRIVALLGLVALLVVSFNIAVPAAHADSGGNQIRIESAQLVYDSSSGTWSWKVVVSATVNDPSITTVNFGLSVSFGYRHLNINKQGTLAGGTMLSGTVEDSYTQVMFLVPYMGPGYYLFVLKGYNAGNNVLLGSDWVDPEGTAG